MIQLCTDGFPGVTCVPNAFIDTHMSQANGDFVKVYIYLLRSLSSDRSLSIGSLADALNFTEADVLRALRYWENTGILRLSLDNAGSIVGIFLGESVSSCTDKAPAAPEIDEAADSTLSMPDTPAPQADVAPGEIHFSADEIDDFRSDEAVGLLLFAIESYLGRPLSTDDMETVLYWHKELSFPIDLIEHLVESCLDSGHATFPYMKKVALSWHSQGIRSVEQARNIAEVHSVTYYGVKNALGISGRELIESEKNYISTWTDEFGFSLDIIKDACRRTIEQTGSPSFKYAHKILEGWHNAGVRHLSDVAPLDDAHRSKAKSLPASAVEYDFCSRSEESDEELEKRLLLSTGQA